MVMFYRDMTSIQLNKPVSSVGEMKFKFKILRALKEFGGVYDYNNPLHFVEIVLSSEFDFRAIKEKVMPLLKPRRKGEEGRRKNESAPTIAGRL